MVRLVDSHAHIQSSAFDADRADVLARARENGVELVMAPGTGIASIESALALARGGAAVAVAAGIHPGEAASATADEWRAVADIAHSPEVVAIGETGLDYYRDQAHAGEQRALFLRHLALAAELHLPIIIHNRQADDDVMRAIADWRADDASRVAILHCFVGPPALAERALALGCYLGFGGPITFKNARDCHESARLVPMDRMLLETDSPFLAPAPHRGARNEPGHVRFVAERIAELRRTDLEVVAAATTENAYRVLGIASRSERSVLV